MPRTLPISHKICVATHMDLIRKADSIYPLSTHYVTGCQEQYQDCLFVWLSDLNHVVVIHSISYLSVEICKQQYVLSSNRSLIISQCVLISDDMDTVALKCIRILLLILFNHFC